MENRNTEQLQSLTTIPNLLPSGQQDPLTLLPLQSGPTLAPLNLTNPTDQQILSIITGDNPNGAFQTVAKYSTNPLATDTSNQIVSFLQPTLAGVAAPLQNRENSWTLDPTPYSPTPLLPNTPTPLTPEQLSRVESTAVNLWQSLLPDHRQLDVNFQITDLANGEIAQAQVTKFSPTGLAIGGTILIDRHAQGAGWFVDPTPLDWSEFTPLTGGSLQAKPDSAAAGKYDLFTALLHELGHISGFGHGDTTFDSKAFALNSDNNHIDSALYPHDLMASGLEVGERRLPSELDITLAASPIIGAYTAYTAPLLGVGIANGDFSINSSPDANYAWQTNGATTISNGIATLSDTSKQLANLTQKFLIPANATKLQFTIKNSQLRSGQPNAAPTPNDAFEVALLDAQMNPLAGRSNGLSNTDSLLNLQADGTVYFSDKVQIGGATISGGKIATTTDRTVTIDLAGITSNTEATLYFDLLSFGSGASHVSVDNVKIFTTTQPAPHLDNATLATNQATGLTIPLPTSVTLEGIELSTLPQHGTVVRNPLDGKITYTPNSDYVGADSFTYLGFDSSGQVSNPATINITVNNVAPTIESIVIPTTIKEGQTIALAATAKDGGSSNNLTYTWNFGDGSNPISGRDITHTYTDNGNYNVTLSVTDKDGGTTEQTSLVKVDNVAPTVNITAPVTDINQGGTLSFGVSYTDPGILDTHTITWNFGDGTAPVTGVTNPSHLFTQAGSKNVSVTITDNDGASTTQSLQIAVANVAPTINSIDIPTNINEGQLVQLTATATDAGNDALIYNWYINGATTPIVGQTINYAFADNGVYPIKLNVIDSNGAITIQSVNVTVDNVAPIIVNIVKPDRINEGEPVQFRAVATDVGINDTLTYIWNFGDSTPLTNGQNVTHVFADNGNYNVILRVTDKDGAFATQTVAVKVDNVAPIIASISQPATIKEGESVQFKATATDSGIDDTLTYNWNFGDSTPTVSGQNASHTFADNGNYDVILTVTDRDGAATTQTIVAKVDNVTPTIISIVKPVTIKEGESVSFKATATDPGIIDTLTYSWNFGDTTLPVIGQNVNHTFADNGNYNITLTVTDKDGAATTQTVVASVDNVMPTIVSIVKPATIKEGESVLFKATATDPGILDTLTYSWNFGDTTPAAVGQSVTHIFADNGNYNVTLTVTDKDGAATTQTVVAKVDNVAPIIVSIVKPTTINEGQSVVFSATVSDPGILDTLTYSWNFGDTTPAAVGQSVTHTFADNGNYNVTLTVTDKDGGVTTQTVIAKVDNVAPTIVSIVKPATINEGQSVAFTASASDPGILDTLTYSWNFGDTTPAVTGQTANHTFADNGNYNVVLTVTDKDGGVTTQTVVAKVDNVAPIIVSIVKPATINEGQAVTFSATATDVGIKDTLTYIWNFGDTTPSVSGQSATHTFADNGNYNVTLTVTDKDGGIATQTVVAKVDNVAPTIVNIVKPATINEGQAVTFSATATDPGVLDTLTYSWNFGDTTSAVTGQTATHTFADNGNYNVVLTVTDKDGGVTTQTVVAKVDNVAPIIASITLPPNVIAGTAAAFTATATDVGIKDTLTYSWNFGDNTTATSGQNTTHTYTTAGTYSIILTVTDKDGAITTQTQNLTVAAPPTTGGIRAGGNITINGSADFDGNTTNRTDDTQIYAGKGISLNGNITLPVKRDAAGNPLKVNGKIVLTDNEITLGTGATTATNPNQYTNFTTATQTINIPAYADLKLQEFTPLASAIVKTFNIQTTPINTSADWNTKFPAAGTVTNPTVVRIINGDLNLPANINLSNYILIVENGNINFYQGNPVLNNVKLIANAGNINLNSTTGTNLSLSASGNINITGNTSLGGTSIINSNGNITTNGGLSMANSTATVKMIAQGDLSVNGNTSLKGQLFTKKNITINGQTTIVGSIDALLNVSIGGNTTIVAK